MADYKNRQDQITVPEGFCTWPPRSRGVTAKDFLDGDKRVVEWLFNHDCTQTALAKELRVNKPFLLGRIHKVKRLINRDSGATENNDVHLGQFLGPALRAMQAEKKTYIKIRVDGQEQIETMTEPDHDVRMAATTLLAKLIGPQIARIALYEFDQYYQVPLPALKEPEKVGRPLVLEEQEEMDLLAKEAAQDLHSEAKELP